MAGNRDDIDRDIQEWADRIEKKYDCPNNAKEAMEMFIGMRGDLDGLLDMLMVKYKLSGYERDNLDEGYIGDIIGDMCCVNPDTQEPYEFIKSLSKG